jgi:copper oxidase (laccase) domain-containing protein
MSNEITVALYLYKRLHELGVRGVHGVPVCTFEVTDKFFWMLADGGIPRAIST